MTPHRDAIGFARERPVRPRRQKAYVTPTIGGCQLHKIRNVADKLPDQLTAPSGCVGLPCPSALVVKLRVSDEVAHINLPAKV